MIDSDDRIGSIIEQIDGDISELNNMDQWLTLYTFKLNVKIFFILCIISLKLININFFFSKL